VPLHEEEAVLPVGRVHQCSIKLLHLGVPTDDARTRKPLEDLLLRRKH
jgi:hypothetical protein